MACLNPPERLYKLSQQRGKSHRVLIQTTCLWLSNARPEHKLAAASSPPVQTCPPSPAVRRVFIGVHNVCSKPLISDARRQQFFFIIIFLFLAANRRLTVSCRRSGGRGSSAAAPICAAKVTRHLMRSGADQIQAFL